MKNIVLTGFMGAGKSSVGRALAGKTGMPVVDTDEEVEKEAGRTVAEIFETRGEEGFRELESRVVARVSALEGHIIVTGGGVVLRKENMEALRKNGVIFYLSAPPEVIYGRVKDQRHRPLLRVEDPLGRIRELLEHRAPFYADHDFAIDTSDLTVDEVAEEV
ncbi:MAG: shikimate kinase, partial [Euryarchaeota archaeon]|nr:shikimate kinase [Euryarchaeota archaeon]